MDRNTSVSHSPVQDLFLGNITSKQLDFSAPFTLVSTAERRTKIHSFVLYFDTFFTNTGEPVPADTNVYLVRDGDPILAEVWPVGGRPHQPRRMSTAEPLKGKGRPKVTSFSTGPASEPTHWKQTVFFLRDPILAAEGVLVISALSKMCSDTGLGQVRSWRACSSAARARTTRASSTSRSTTESRTPRRRTRRARRSCSCTRSGSLATVPLPRVWDLSRREKRTKKNCNVSM